MKTSWTWGKLTGQWIEHDIRDKVVDPIHHWSEKTGIAVLRMIVWIGIGKAKFYSWRRRYGKANEHNARTPRDHWLEDWEKKAILDYHEQHPLSGYRRLTYEMLDADIVAPDLVLE